MNKVVVLGATGVFGARIAEELARHPGAALVVAARGEARARVLAERLRCTYRAVDHRDAAALAELVEGALLVIDAAGPFQRRDHAVARACLAADSHFLDLSDGRAHVLAVTQLDEEARRRGRLVASGASTTPAITHALVADLAAGLAHVESIDVALAPGNRNPRGAATVASILAWVGRPVRVWEGGRWVTRLGWSDTELRELPAPVGRRRSHLCDVPDLELMPAEFAATSVRFGAGLELRLLDGALDLIALRGGVSRKPARRARMQRRAARAMAAASRLVLPFGTGAGALAAWVEGVDAGGQRVQRRAALVTDRDGVAAPAAPAVLLAQALLETGPPAVGARPCTGLVDLDTLVGHLRPRGWRLVRGDERGWLG